MFAFMTRSGNDYLRHHSQQICLDHEPAQSHRHTEPPCVHQQHWEVAAQRNQLAEPGQLGFCTFFGSCFLPPHHHMRKSQGPSVLRTQGCSSTRYVWESSGPKSKQHPRACSA